MLTQLGEAYLEGGPEEAERRATQALELACRHGERANGGPARRRKAKEHVARAIAMYREMNMSACPEQAVAELGGSARRPT